MPVAVADTHAVIWFLSDSPRLSVAAGAVFDTAAERGDQVAVSSITLAEIVYLIEKGRIPMAAFASLILALGDSASVLVEAPFDRPIAQALLRVDRRSVPDLPDRIIAATALHLGVPLISKDRQIQASNVTTVG
jgi:PIN domain nuclease of toxin-antitoxin system